MKNKQCCKKCNAVWANVVWCDDKQCPCHLPSIKGTDKGELPEEWEKEFLEVITCNAHPQNCICLLCEYKETIIDYIRFLLSRELPPAIGVSQWKKMGLKYGYWAYFEKEVKSDAEVEVIEMVEKLKPRIAGSLHQSYNDGKMDFADDLISKLKK